MTYSLSIVLPCHNEADSIHNTLREISDVLDSDGKVLNFEIIISEDGSNDATRSVIENFIQNSFLGTRVRLLSQSERLGYSLGVVRGVTEVKQPITVFMDSDGQYEPNEIVGLVSEVEPGQIVLGVRSPRRDPIARLVYSGAFYFLYRLLRGPKLKDPSSPFVAVRTADLAFLSGLKPKLEFGFWWEFQLRANNAGLAVKEIQVTHRIRVSGGTRVYNSRKLPRIVQTHVLGLFKLWHELKA